MSDRGRVYIWLLYGLLPFKMRETWKETATNEDVHLRNRYVYSYSVMIIFTHNRMMKRPGLNDSD